MPILRFPNPVSDIEKFWITYRIIYEKMRNVEDFGHDEMTDVLINHGLVTSSGATGEEARRRSFRDDRSRDPLYNQLKMYSELFRMLGWMHPGGDRTHFVISELGEHIGEIPTWHDVRPLVEECVLNIVFPNPHVESRRGHSMRPFPLMLGLMRECGGFIQRDELIIAVLSLENDRVAGVLSSLRYTVNSLRGDFEGLEREVSRVAGDLQVNTVRNYTRFPLGILRSSGWAKRSLDRETYNRPLNVYRLTPKGVRQAQNLQRMVDVRSEDLAFFSRTAVHNFILLAHYSMLERAGYHLGQVDNYISELENGCSDILSQLPVSARSDILYSPFQQTEKVLLASTSEFEERNYGGDG